MVQFFEWHFPSILQSAIDPPSHHPPADPLAVDSPDREKGAMALPSMISAEIRNDAGDHGMIASKIKKSISVIAGPMIFIFGAFQENG